MQGEVYILLHVIQYCRKYVKHVNEMEEALRHDMMNIRISDNSMNATDDEDDDVSGEGEKLFVFLSHYKLESGTEAVPDLQPGSPSMLQRQADQGVEAVLDLQPVKVEALSLPALLPPGLLSEEPEVSDEAPQISKVCLPPGSLSMATPEAQFPPGLPLPALGREEWRSPSHGSLLHGTGNCRPCAWFWKAAGCQNGMLCEHCHVCPAGELRLRKKAKQTMMRLGLATPKAGIHQDTPAYPFCGLPLSPLPVQNVNLNELLPSTSPPTTPLAPPSTIVLGGIDEASSTTCGGSDESEEAEFSAHSSPPGLAPPQLPSFPPLPTVPLWPSTTTVSWGSMQHGTGTCRPCAWFWKPGGCENQERCEYCHLCGEGELKSRKKNKQAMMRMGLITPKSDASSSENEAKYALSLAACL